ncbi:DUF2207 domain-containing protein [Alteribacillus iranensis]|uniref:Uncharacterized membrane protein n=1 Tax=Alteribacillus iranensis TaxID=930128 RepID=A0A1I2D586_9BACI|nr:DUF2207 domain-containing protein [Alteribacillus iranensis]SFE75682.1 Uncharacterized membrane protein [Alteribacillus iranensis]
MKKASVFLFFVLLFVLYPSVGFAVEYDITKTDIHATLHPDGEVEVKESHTYSFEGDFNGITRTIIPKEDSAISDITASENNTALPVEKDGNLYKIHRDGSDETVTIDLVYTIQHGMDIYEDVAQFYWPFFDESNESTYQDLTITIVPPDAGEVKAAYGYDEAYDTAYIKDGGIVTFELGEVPDETNGDIRVAYDRELFPEAAITSDEPMLDTILADKEALDEKVAARAENKARWAAIAPWLIGGMTLLAFVLTVYGLWKRQETMHEVRRQEKGTGHFPKEAMSLPAMLLFMNHGQLPVSALTASFLDLVKKGNIEKQSENVFHLNNRNTDYDHERHLLDWMFGRIGSEDDTLHVKDIEAYTKEKKNQVQYRNDFHQWREAVKREYKQYKLYTDFTAPRWIAGFTVLAALPISIFLAYYGVLWSIAAFVLTLYFVGFALAYRPLTIQGHMLKTKLQTLTLGDQWKKWDSEDSIPAFLYQAGMGKRDVFKEPARSAASGDWMMFLLIGSMLHPTLQEADRQAVATAATSTGGGGGGAGVGGGGGGSGAF